MIVVSGASGQLGRRTIGHLRERVDARQIRALTRTPDRIADLGVAVREADFNRPDELVEALDGAERVLLIATNEYSLDGRRITQHTNAVQAAAKAGVGHLIYTSVSRATDAGNPSPVAPDHAATEAALAESGLSCTVLRENYFTDLLLLSAPAAVATGVLADNSGKGATAYVTRDDVAATAAGMLADGGFAEEVVDLTGPAAVSAEDLAVTLHDITGRPVRYEYLTDGAFVDSMVSHGQPEPMAQIFAAANRAIREGWLGQVTDAVERISGRRPTSVAEFLAANRSALMS